MSGERDARPPVTWTLREAGPADEAGILACREVTFAGEDPEKATPAYWRWEFLENHAGPSRLYVAEDGERIVGHYAITPQRFVLDGEPLAGSIVVDVMTHPEYRFQGMFTRLGRFALEHAESEGELAFTTGYPIRPEVLPGHLKVGWRVRFGIGTYVQPLRPGPLIAARFPLLGRLPLVPGVLGLATGLPVQTWGRWKLPRPRGLTVERLTHVDAEAFGELWRRVLADPPKGCLMQERTPEYLAWRFDANPGRTYVHHVLRDDRGGIRGWVASRRAALLDVPARIAIDVLLRPGEPEQTLRALLADVRELALSEGSAMVAMMVTQPNPYVPDPATLGFLAAPYTFSFITRPLGGTPVTEDDGLRWHLTWGDTDDL